MTVSDHYNSVDEFADDCKAGMDIEFSYRGIDYGILGWKNGGPLAYRKKPFFEEQFSDVNELLDGFIIDGKPLRTVVTDITLA